VPSPQQRVNLLSFFEGIRAYGYPLKSKGQIAGLAARCPKNFQHQLLLIVTRGTLQSGIAYAHRLSGERPRG
jgi:hypothetical protein